MSGAVGHWWIQRVSSVALIPLALWLLWAAVSLAGLDHAGAVDFAGRPFNALMIVLTTAITAFHAQLGIQVIVEDYVPGEALVKTLIYLTRAGCLLGTLVVVAVVFRLSFGA